MWIREERHFTAYPKDMDKQDFEEYSGYVVEGVVPHMVLINWYSQTNGWQLGEVRVTGRYWGVNPDPEITDDTEDWRHITIKLVSGTKHGQIAEWLDTLIRQTEPKTLSEFVNDEALGWVAAESRSV